MIESIPGRFLYSWCHCKLYSVIVAIPRNILYFSGIGKLFSVIESIPEHLWEERANLSAFRTFVRFVLVWICRFPLPLGVWEGLRFVIVALPGLFSYLFFLYYLCHK